MEPTSAEVDCGAEGMGEKTCVLPEFHQSSGALGGQDVEDCCTLSTWPQVGVWLCEATEPSSQWVDKGQSEVSGPHGGQR